MIFHDIIYSIAFKVWILEKVTSVKVNLWPVEHFCPPKKTGDKVFNWPEVHFYGSNFLQNPYYVYFINTYYMMIQIPDWRLNMIWRIAKYLDLLKL